VKNNQDMKKILLILTAALFTVVHLHAQVEPKASDWKTWFISSGKDFRLPAPSSNKAEIAEVLSAQQKLDQAGIQKIMYWNAGAPGYRWQEFITKFWMTDTSSTAALAAMLLNVAIYDATIAAWDSKYAYKRARPFAADKRIKSYVPDPNSPSYPCEHSVAAGVAATVISHFFPHLADSVNRMAQQAIASRIASGAAFPSDTRAGFDLGKKIAAIEIEKTKDHGPKTWDGKRPDRPGIWSGPKPMFPTMGTSKPVVLESGSQFRPGPPPDFAKDMDELRKFKPGFRSTYNAFYYANTNDDVLSKKMFEYNIHINPPRAARMYAIAAIGMYDGFISCWDAKYAYWGIRPNQYDTSFKPVLFFSPPFPGYPSGHAMIGAVTAEILSYFFPAEKPYFDKRAKDGAESRFQGGIHFRTDNEVGLEMGKKVGAVIVQKVKADGSD
jgi:membrane-associated phospholipid phosphatase